MAKGPSKWTCWCLFIEARYNRARSVIGAIQAVWPSSQVFSWSNERPPEYFTAPSVSPPLISFKVGKPRTPFDLHRSRSCVQSTFTTLTPSTLLYSAASLSHVGARRLQWPHHGA